MNVYRYYRDLLCFHERGDPALMLRCINPAEAKLADSAAGVHVKFRLAGVSHKTFYCQLKEYLPIKWHECFSSANKAVTKYTFYCCHCGNAKIKCIKWSCLVLVNYLEWWRYWENYLIRHTFSLLTILTDLIYYQTIHSLGCDITQGNTALLWCLWLLVDSSSAALHT